MTIERHTRCRTRAAKRLPLDVLLIDGCVIAEAYELSLSIAWDAGAAA